MKMIWKELLICLFMGMVLPGTMLNMTKNFVEEKTPKASAETESAVTAVAEPFSGNPQVQVLFSDGTVQAMDLEEYLVGVVLAEMPASFEGEALKAQAVAARTYAVKAQNSGKHAEGAVCTDSRCCQAYISEISYMGNGGTELGIKKIRGAVSATRGKVLTYHGELIDATYFSCSGGSTEDAQAVWGADLPYLKAVDSPGEEGAEYYRDTVIIPRDRAEMLLGLALPENPGSWLGTCKRTPGSGIATMEIGGRIFKGTELRTLLGLRSTAINIKADDRGLVIETRGWGHRVGMSQYGADAMAVAGSTYEEILSHYYTDTELTQYQAYEKDLPEFTEDLQGPVAEELIK